MLIITFLFLQSSYAVEKEVIAYIGCRPITNIEVFKSLAITFSPNYECKPSHIKFEIEDMVPIILFKQYAAKNGIKITRQEVEDAIAKEANSRGIIFDQSIQQKGVWKAHEDLANAKKEYQNILNNKVVEHFNPDVRDVNEGDIQKYVENYKRQYSYSGWRGSSEAIRYKYIGVRAETLAKNNSLRKELDKIKKRINDGESFATVTKDYSDKQDYVIGTELSGWMGVGKHKRGDWGDCLTPKYWISVSDYKKEGWDALTPWSALKGKAVLANVRESGEAVLLIEDYQPDRHNTHMKIEDALNDKDFRNVIIEEARKYKFNNECSYLTEKLKMNAGGIRYRGDKKEIFQRMANQYKQYRLEIHKNDSNSNDQH